MTLQQILAIAATLLVFIGFPLLVGIELWRNRGKKASERRSHASTGSAAFLGAMDRIVRPSVEHQIQEENRVVKEDEDVGGE